MSETTNYKLYLSDDPTEKVQEWRKKINGPENSNMVKIDTALGEKAERSIAVPGMLLTSMWTGSTAPYTQEIIVEGAKEDQNGYISVASDATPEQMNAAIDAVLSVAGQDGETLVIAAEEQKPEIDIPVVTILLG